MDFRHSMLHAALLVILLFPLVAFSKPMLRGMITASDTRSPLPSVTVRVVSLPDTQKIFGAVSNVQGKYAVHGLMPGAYRVTFSCIGYARVTNELVDVAADGATLNTTMAPERLSLNNVVITATRQREKVIDAPASVSVIDAAQIAEVPAFTPMEHLRGVAGVDLAQQGLLAQSIVARGFNSVFNGEMMILVDNRLACIPALQANVPYFIPIIDEDIERIELVRGPGSALYGPNASSGVVNVITKSPFSSRGTSLSITGGERSLFQGSLRHAGTIGERIGYKISGQYFRGLEWPEPIDPVEKAARDTAIAHGARGDTLLLGRRDPMLQRFGLEGRMDFLLSDDITANLTAGMHQDINSIDHTDVGASEAQNWRYTYYQARLSYGAFFAQTYLNQNNAGKSYQLGTGNLLVDRSTQWVTQVQHSASIGARERLTYGLDALLTRPVTDGTINGKYENNDDINEFGGYLQSQTGLIDETNIGKIDLVLAGRLDKNNRIEKMIFSPRAGVIYRPSDEHTFRVTFNEAYTAPQSTTLFLDFVASPNVFGFPAANAVDLRAQGTVDGFHFAKLGNSLAMHTSFGDPTAAMPVDSAAQLWPVIVQLLAAQGVDISGIPAPSGTSVHSVMQLLNPTSQQFTPVSTVQDIAKIGPTTTQTFEIGYKGIIENKWEVGIDLYRSKVTNFRSPLMVITPSVFMNGNDVKAYVKPYIKAGLIQSGKSEAEAEKESEQQSTMIGGAVGQIPIGTVSPNEAVNPTALILASRNFGTVNINGIDLSVTYTINDAWSAAVNYSYIDNNFFSNLDGVADLALNAPKHKGSVALRYNNKESRLTADVLYRHSDGFEMNSGVYVGTVKPYNLVDATVQIAVPSTTGMTFTLAASNLLDYKHQEFVGCPFLGRMVTGRISYTL